MSQETIKVPIRSGADYQFHIRETAGGVLVDFTGATFDLVGRTSANSEDELFRYSEIDAGVIVVGLFPLTVDGVTEDYNLQVNLPNAMTSQLKTANYTHVHLGFAVTYADGIRKQLISNGKFPVSDSVA